MNKFWSYLAGSYLATLAVLGVLVAIAATVIGIAGAKGALAVAMVVFTCVLAYPVHMFLQETKRVKEMED
ncbi:MAG: hypothetical protein Q8761_02660 [Sweet potato little leaf phytoplasma]|nr:hypothetical protein [Sweet potato little leaf phytoplasma]